MANLHGQDGSFLVLFKDSFKKEVFLVFRTDYPLWVLSGGGIEASETPQDAATRETLEETGFNTKVTRFVGTYEYPHKKTYLFEGLYLSGTYKPEFKGNIGKWFPLNCLPLDVTSSTRQKIFDATHHQGKPFHKTISNELPLSNNLLIILRHPLAFIKFIKNNFRKIK